MSPLLMAPLAVTAGVLSFTSPCCLPLLPGYLAYITGLPHDGEAGRRLRLRAAALFVTGFSAVFTMLGVGVGVAGASVARHVPDLGRGAGLVLIVAGALTAGLVQAPDLLQRERRPSLDRVARGPRGAFLLGAAFAAGWSPCIGPVLASILAVSASSQTAVWGAALLFLYSLGLGLPFMALAAGADRASWWPLVRNHTIGMQRGGGALLLTVGMLLVTGTWDHLMQPLQRGLASLDWPPV